MVVRFGGGATRVACGLAERAKEQQRASAQAWCNIADAVERLLTNRDSSARNRLWLTSRVARTFCTGCNSSCGLSDAARYPTMSPLQAVPSPPVMNGRRAQMC